MENNEEKVRLVLSCELHGTPKDIVNAYFGILGCSVTASSVDLDEVHKEALGDSPILLRRIALRLRKSILEHGCDEQILLDVEKKMFNVTNDADVKTMIKELLDKFKDQ